MQNKIECTEVKDKWSILSEFLAEMILKYVGDLERDACKEEQENSLQTSK